MKLSISKKFCKRFIKCLAMFAPLAYLFGSLFFYLNGVHGSMELLGEGDYLSNVESVDGVNMFDSRPSYNMYGYSIVNVNGLLDISGVATSIPAYNQLSLSISQSFVRDGSKYLFDFPSFSGYSFGLGGYAPSESSFIWSPTASSSWTGGLFIQVPSVGFEIDIQGFYCNIWNLTEMFGSGNEPTISEFHSKYPLTYYSYGLNHLDYKEYTAWPDSPTPQSNNYYLFGQFFSQGNFLSQWGENAISVNPKGFAPFGTFLKYIDENMLHLSDSQIGLMAYGYLYYTLHVLIAFFAFDILGFIPLFLQRVTDKIGGSEDD